MSAATWTLVELEPALAARSGLPERLAVPSAVAEAHEPLERERVAAWARAFAREHPEHRLAPVLLRLAAAEPYRRLGERLLGAGRFEEAERALARAVEVAPFDAASRFNRAVALRRSGHVEEALTELESIEWAYEDQHAFLVALGGLLEELDEPDRAVVEYERALVLAPGDPYVLARLEALGSLVRLDGPDGEPYWLTPPDFERVVRHELAEASDSPRALLVRGSWLAGSGHWQLAGTAAELAIVAAPGTAEAWALAGRARAALGDREAARIAFEQAATLDGTLVEVARMLALDPEDPAGDLVRAQIHARRHAGSAAAWLVLGDVLAREGAEEDALAAYRQSVALAPDLCGAGHARAAVARAERQ